ncbi:MAG: phosphoribosylaminoimidazolesuccinocarboxamide synthase [Candidatus Peribacteraceae bacterium]
MIDPQTLRPFLATALKETNFSGLGQKYAGKVRDVYLQAEQKRRILIATDRQSAFDISWCTIPLKGQVLSQLSAWWFERVADIMPTQIIATPDPNVTIAKDLKILPIEIVVRAYLTGSTKTSAWVNYSQGVRNFCGNQLPENMAKNEPFAHPIITPTTKAEDDELIDPAGIIEHGLATQKQWDEITEKAFALFTRGQEIAAQRGLILVDTKYEMGVDEDGVITIADEVHTPDSSRYWLAETYENRLKNGEEPDSLDKEFFRLWMRSQGFEYGDKSTWPQITDDVRIMLAAKYIDLYERMTGTAFTPPQDANVLERIERNLAPYRVE